MATYTFNVSDAGDAIMHEIAPDLGWDGVSPFDQFLEQMFLAYACSIAAQVKHAKVSAEMSSALQQASDEVTSAFAPSVTAPDPASPPASTSG
jgi:hypothetical protein